MALQRTRGGKRFPPHGERIKDMEGWCVNKALSEDRSADYRRLLKTTKDYLSRIESK